MSRPILLCTNPAQADALRAHLATAGIECGVVTEMPPGFAVESRWPAMPDIALVLPEPPTMPVEPPAFALDLGSLLPAPRRAEPNPDRGRHAEKSRRRWERKAEQAREHRDGFPHGCEWIPGDGGSRG